MSKGITRSDRKRASIVEAAITEFHANGFPGTSMDVIAATAGVSKRTVYNHFKSKDELFCAISSEACRRVLDLPVANYCADTGLEEQLRSIATSILDLVSSPGFMRLVRVTLAERVRRPHVAAEAFGEIEKGEFGSTSWIRAAASDGRLVVDDAVGAHKRFAALLKEFGLWPQLFGFRQALDARERQVVIDEAVAMFLARYRQ